jgi:hypothetical protein
MLPIIARWGHNTLLIGIALLTIAFLIAFTK